MRGAWIRVKVAPLMSRMLTTPIYYVNATPHLGHFYTTMLADTLTRHFLQRGETVFFLTGTDEHGQKVEDMAKKQGESSKAFVDKISAAFKDTWDQCGLQYDRFYRTTEPNHIKAVQHALQTLKDKGEIVFREYEGLYDVGSERFVKESELTPEGLCPDTLTKPEMRKESNYFFLMSKYQARLIAHYEGNPDALQPAHYRNEVLAFLKGMPLEDLCISRPKDRLNWGIELPFDQNFVTYVWFDALLNYLVATGWPGEGKGGTASGPWNRALWESVTHFIAKDIVKAHGVYWPTMLMALDVKLFKQLQVHGYWMVGATKMSKTIGNVVRPLEIKEKYGLENLRFYLLREMSFGLDSTFTLEAFIQGSNAHLANGIGNLASRVLTICSKNLGGTLTFSESDQNEGDRALLAKRAETLKEWDAAFGELKYQNALKAWCELVTACDLYINDNKPWALAKDPSQAQRLKVVLGVAMMVLRTLGVLIYPVLPEASRSLLKSLGHDVGTDRKGPDLRLALSESREFSLVGDVPKLFARLQMPEVVANS